MPIFNIGSGNPYKLPVLDSVYPVDVTQLQQADGSATFEVKIATPGVPDEYTYQWYVDGVAIVGETSTTYTRTGLTSAVTHTVYCIVTSKAGSVQSRTAVLTVKSLKPEYTYSGASTYVDDSNGNCRIKFTTSGKLKFTNLGCFTNGIDIFAVGGGAGSASGLTSAGGGGGYTTTKKAVAIEEGVEYTVTVGSGGSAGGNAGGTSSFDSLASAAGGGSKTNIQSGGSGGGGGGKNGPGGNGGSNGSAGSDGYNGASKGSGQGTTTREFGLSNGTLYSGGGGGATDYDENYETPGTGGSGGGGRGSSPNRSGTAGTANTGGGGGGGSKAGGSGIVIIRDKR